MEKVKVSKEVSEAIEAYLYESVTVMKRLIDESKGLLVAEHCGQDWRKYEIGQYSALNGISTFELMQALIVGYEAEKTSEDVILEQLSRHIEAVKFYAERRNLDVCEIEQERFSSGYVRGVEDFVKAYGIKIEGVTHK